jgi:hypothetical protein
MFAAVFVGPIFVNCFVVYLQQSNPHFSFSYSNGHLFVSDPLLQDDAVVFFVSATQRLHLWI